MLHAKGHFRWIIIPQLFSEHKLHCTFIADSKRIRIFEHQLRPFTPWCGALRLHSINQIAMSMGQSTSELKMQSENKINNSQIQVCPGHNNGMHIQQSCLESQASCRPGACIFSTPNPAMWDWTKSMLKTMQTNETGVFCTRLSET